jgi:hypothetical protein
VRRRRMMTCELPYRWEDMCDTAQPSGSDAQQLVPIKGMQPTRQQPRAADAGAVRLLDFQSSTFFAKRRGTDSRLAKWHAQHCATR